MTLPVGAGLPDGTAVWIRQPFAAGHGIRRQQETKRIPAVGERRQGKFATAANPLGFHVLAWTVPLEATPQPLPAKARTPNHFAQGRCRANTPMFGAGWWI